MPPSGMEANHELIRQLEKGYRMEKPAFAPNYIGEIMSNCWKLDPKERPRFSQIEEQINNEIESAVSDHYLNLNESYEKLNEEKVNATAIEPLGLSKALGSKEKLAERPGSMSNSPSKKPSCKAMSLQGFTPTKYCISYFENSFTPIQYFFHLLSYTGPMNCESIQQT